MSPAVSFALDAACSAAAFALSRNPMSAPFEQLAQQAALLVASASRGLHHSLGRPRKRQCLKSHVSRPGHVHEEEPLAGEEASLDAALKLDVVRDSRLDHHHAARVDDERLAVGEVEVEEVSATV